MLMIKEPDSVASTSKEPCQICKDIDKEHALAIKCKLKKEEEKKFSEFNWRKHCGCLKTSEKLKELLKLFPQPPPPAPPPPPPPSSPASIQTAPSTSKYENASISGNSKNQLQPSPIQEPGELIAKKSVSYAAEPLKKSPKSWRVVSELVQILQLFVTTTALMVYYIIYCYMQLIYYLLSSAIYFHNADRPMKVTIAVVTITSLIVGFNLMIRMEKLVGLHY